MSETLCHRYTRLDTSGQLASYQDLNGFETFVATHYATNTHQSLAKHCHIIVHPTTNMQTLQKSFTKTLQTYNIFVNMQVYI